MAQPSNRLHWLFDRYWQNTCSAEERAEFLGLAAKEENRAAIDRLLKEAMETTLGEPAIEPQRADAIFNAIVNKEASSPLPRPTERTRPVFRLKRLAVAASVLLVIGWGVHQLLPSATAPQTAQVQKEKKTPVDVVPGHDNAVLTLSDGTMIILDSAANGTLAKEGSMQIAKLNGKISYTGRERATVPLYNTIHTVKGNQYQVVLADGSKVWLNAASSIRFPAAFSENERRVQITGEAYFEVAHNAAAPFKVDANGMEITVLGTHFNVNAYDDEASVKTTLLEGAVRLTNGKEEGLLKPGQQATVSQEGQFAIRSGVDLDEVVAWKNGVFIFNRQPLQNIMRQISRWYDVEVVYEGKTGGTFSGVVSRQESISQVLKIMEVNGVRFRMEGRKIIVGQ